MSRVTTIKNKAPFTSDTNINRMSLVLMVISLVLVPGMIFVTQQKWKGESARYWDRLM